MYCGVRKFRCRNILTPKHTLLAVCRSLFLVCRSYFFLCFGSALPSADFEAPHDDNVSYDQDSVSNYWRCLIYLLHTASPHADLDATSNEKVCGCHYQVSTGGHDIGWDALTAIFDVCSRRFGGVIRPSRKERFRSRWLAYFLNWGTCTRSLKVGTNEAKLSHTKTGSTIYLFLTYSICFNTKY